ncbi:hypothetical protein N7476_006038 [Penicillium atrosanguineum]|uniref:Calcineurin-like phosphoesterase domain-containing protein n=1 Tax=Penicillium atrosanguineum TaxID=1132637 RepID=A0A9W9PWF6_9EURO|nr:hypothetical protein N7476_006038 [Penicillium atrosanguineum]
MRRKTRFVCVSDTHGYTPSEAGFKLPAGDVLIHAGDLTNKGTMSELRRTMDWISKADFEIKLIVAGNHDITLDSEFYAQHGQGFHGDQLEDPRKCTEFITRSTPSVVLLQHQAAVIRLDRADGPKTSFKVFGSPYCQFQGKWAFGYESSKAKALWDPIPLDTDIIVTHTPPRSHCDQKPNGTFVGCDALRQALSRVRPPLAVCGHVHEGRGYERIRWQPALIKIGLDADGVDFVTRCVLPPSGSKKQSLVDLTGRREARLDSEGFSCSAPASSSPMLPSGVSAVSGQGFAPSLSAADTHGLDHALRMLRKETCIVNAAIVATSWPHRGGKRFHAPIVVDLELPVWQDTAAADSQCI